jgi:hypothetical protein
LAGFGEDGWWVTDSALGHDLQASTHPGQDEKASFLLLQKGLEAFLGQSSGFREVHYYY